MESGALFLTIDYFFQRFEKQELRHDLQQAHTVGAVVLPDQLLQLLRPFVPETEDSNRRFVETFAILEIRAVGGEYAAIKSEALSYMDYLATLPEPIQVQLLTSRLLSQQFEQLEKHEGDIGAIIDSGLVQINQIVTAERAKALEHAAHSDAELDRMRHEYKEMNDKLRLAEAAAAEKTTVAAQAEQTIGTRGDELQETKKQIAAKNTRRANAWQKLKEQDAEDAGKEADRWMRIRTIVVFAVVVGVAILCLRPWVGNWQDIEPISAFLSGQTHCSKSTQDTQ